MPRLMMPVQRVFAGEGGQGVQQLLRQLVQLGHVALGHYIEQMSLAQVVDAAILRGQVWLTYWPKACSISRLT